MMSYIDIVIFMSNGREYTEPMIIANIIVNLCRNVDNIIICSTKSSE